MNRPTEVSAVHLIGSGIYVSEETLEICGLLGMNLDYLVHPAPHPGVTAALKPVGAFVNAFVRITEHIALNAQYFHNSELMERCLQLEFLNGKFPIMPHLWLRYLTIDLGIDAIKETALLFEAWGVTANRNETLQALAEVKVASVAGQRFGPIALGKPRYNGYLDKFGVPIGAEARLFAESAIISNAMSDFFKQRISTLPNATEIGWMKKNPPSGGVWTEVQIDIAIHRLSINNDICFNAASMRPH
jgi:hypothetical protein